MASTAAGDRSLVTRRPLASSRIEQLRGQLTTRELEIVGHLAKLRLVTTDQVARLVFGEAETATALRLARRHLERLRRFGLVRRFADRSRDRKVGAPGHVHALTAAGLRLTPGGHGIGVRQGRAYRPSDQFLAHRLAICELIARLAEQERTGGPSLREYQAEPDSWRSYFGPAGQRQVIKPDCLVRLGVGDTEVSTFCEIDLGTERPATIADKCQAYWLYELSGEEVRRYGVFPGVVFIAPTRRRARQIGAVIRRQPASARELFAVATEDEALVALAHIEI